MASDKPRIVSSNGGPRESMVLVRRFTLKQEHEASAEPLTQALVARAEWEMSEEARGARNFSDSTNEVMSFLNVNSATYTTDDLENANSPVNFEDIENLDEVSDKLEESWKKVRKILEKNSGTPAGSKSITPSSPDIRIVNMLLHEAEVKFKRNQKSKSGIAKQWFRSVAQILGKNNYLFDLLPTGDKYTSVITGSFMVIVKACMTYEHVAEGIADYLYHISDDLFHLGQIVLQLQGRQDEYIKSQKINIYCEIFKFMVNLLDKWFSSRIKRILASLGDSLKDSLDQAIIKIHEYRMGAGDHANRATLGQLQQSFKSMVGLSAEAGLFSVARDYRQERSAQDKTTGQLQPPTSLSIEAGRVVTQPSSRASSPGPSSHGDSSVLHTSPDADSTELDGGLDSEPEWEPEWTTKSILASTKYLERYSQAERINNLTGRSKNLSVSRSVFRQVHDWLTSTASEAIMVQGPARDEQPSRSTLTSAFVLERVRQVKVPVIGYFCYYDYLMYNTYDRADELLKLVLSLIYQLALALPEDIDSTRYVDIDLSPSKWDFLNQKGSVTLELLGPSIDLLGDLLTVAPPLLFCIVDGLQHLDRDSSPAVLKTSLQRFLEVLCKAASAETGSSRTMKLLLSTDGSCLPLRAKEEAGLLKIIREDSRELRIEPMRIYDSEFSRQL